MDALTQPLRSADLAAFVFAMLAVLFAILWKRDGERGMGWIALAYCIFAANVWLNSHDLLSSAPMASRSATLVLLSIAVAAFNAGMLLYLRRGLPQVRWRLAVAVMLPLAVAVCWAVGLAPSRPISKLMVTASFLVVVAAAFDAWRREPRAGHMWIAAGVLSIPVFSVLALVTRGDDVHMRYFLQLPLIFFGLLLITVSLRRRSIDLLDENAQRRAAERALTTLNASLEATVAQRTLDLQNMVAGLESFNRNVSHDLRGELSGIAGLARVAHAGLLVNDTSIAHRALPLIAAQSERSVELVTALLTLAQMSDQKVAKVMVNLGELTAEVLASIARMSTSTSAAGAAPKVIVGVLPWVYADASLLRPVLTNLLSNAVKFCAARPDGCIEVAARVDATATVVYVRDNGVGFAGHSAEGMFQPFSQFHGKEYGGSGVGLSIVRRAIERQGGRVWAESSVGQGASFFFLLPNAPGV